MLHTIIKAYPGWSLFVLLLLGLELLNVLGTVLTRWGK